MNQSWINNCWFFILNSIHAGLRHGTWNIHGKSMGRYFGFCIQGSKGTISTKLASDDVYSIFLASSMHQNTNYSPGVRMFANFYVVFFWYVSSPSDMAAVYNQQYDGVPLNPLEAISKLIHETWALIICWRPSDQENEDSLDALRSTWRVHCKSWSFSTLSIHHVGITRCHLHRPVEKPEIAPQGVPPPHPPATQEHLWVSHTFLSCASDIELYIYIQ